MYKPTLNIVVTRHPMDCGVVCLAMLCGVSYEEALMAFRSNVCMEGVSIRQLQAAARRLGEVLRWSRRVSDLEAQTGILQVRAIKEAPADHLIILKSGQVIDVDASIWDLDVFLATKGFKPRSLLTLDTEGE